ncbi:MAG: hypothetical protein J3Q66DRAFT_346979 [Benniella sp.]|nr:MAG: hypothetical protein J3Q66DRAFT_346979 [Benniella sp.]
MDYSPSSDTTLYRDKGEHRRFTSHPELADLEPNDQRQTQNTIDTYAATEHSMDRDEHSQLYTNPHPRGLHNTAVRPFEDRPPRPPTTWSFSTAGSHNLPSLAPKPHTMTTGQTTETSTPVDDNKQRLPLLNKDSNASKGIKTVVEGATSSSRIGAAEAEGTAHPFKVISARGTPKGPLPIDVQISLLTSVLKHDPFNCPIRRTTQVWERISREQGIRARTCARRYDNIIQASIAGRDRPSGSEEQIATKKRLLEQLFVMMNQPQAIVRMQKKRRYRSEEADRRLLLETIRLNPFAQKVGQVAKAWEDVRDALGMKVHARQCIRRVNRMIKPYQLRERMYKGNIPEELREVNDELVKQVIQLMYLGGHSGSLEEDDGQSNDEDSVSGMSDPDDHDDGFTGSEARKRELPQDDDELEEDEDDKMVGLNDVEQNSGRSQKQEFYIPSMRITGTSEAATATDQSVSSEYHLSRNPGYSVGTRKRQKEAGVNDGTRPLESEFRPQRIWGSSPYSNEALARSSSGLYVSRDRSNRTSSTTVKGEQYDCDPQQSSRARAGKSDDATLYGGDLDHRSVLAQRPSSMDVAHRPVAALSPRSAHAPPPSGPSLSTSSSTLSVDPLLHQTVLREFHVVKDYLGRLEGQRQRDKNNQKAMFNIIEDLQHQVQEQQRHIEDLQSQVQNGYPPRSYHDSSATTSSPHSQRSNHYYDSSPTRYRYYSQHHSQSGREYSRSPSP